ncbi:MAG: hypothetical protein OIF40_12015 [Mangrovicoccus sp.]|nr:hypothetical protein [Mangrovicoccus sp.]
MGFRFAAQNRRTVSSLCHPDEVIDQDYSFCVLHRSHRGGEFLYLYETGDCTGSETRAPDELSLSHAMVASLVSRGPEPGNETFLLNREIPEGAHFEGLFLPAEGFLTLSYASAGPKLSGSIRVSCSRPKVAVTTRAAIAHVLLDYGGSEGYVAHFDATYLPWSKEILPHDIFIESF